MGIQWIGVLIHVYLIHLHVKLYSPLLYIVTYHTCMYVDLRIAKTVTIVIVPALSRLKC